MVPRQALVTSQSGLGPESEKDHCRGPGLRSLGAPGKKADPASCPSSLKILLLARDPGG